MFEMCLCVCACKTAKQNEKEEKQIGLVGVKYPKVNSHLYLSEFSSANVSLNLSL